MPAKPRVIRVFLSSTFRDFAEERDLLVKKVFPELRRLCRERKVDLVEVDLRWGITEAESRQGKILPICLGEIDRARPYFMGFIGDRYGWVPEGSQYPLGIVEREPWLRDHQGGKSVTELEILHGVLNNPEMAGRAFFYFRDSNYSQGKGGDYLSEDATSAAKLEALKDRIRDSQFPLVEDYANPEVLADKVRADLAALIDKEYPANEVPDELTLERMRHEAYLWSLTKNYIGANRRLKAFDSAISSNNGIRDMLLWGESGCGKSALLANWIQWRRKINQSHYIIYFSLNRFPEYNSCPLSLITTIVAFIIRDLCDDCFPWSEIASFSDDCTDLTGYLQKDRPLNKLIDQHVRHAGMNEFRLQESLFIIEYLRRLASRGIRIELTNILEDLFSGLINLEVIGKTKTKIIIVLDELVEPSILDYLPKLNQSIVSFLVSTSQSTVKDAWCARDAMPSDKISNRIETSCYSVTHPPAVFQMSEVEMTSQDVRDCISDTFQKHGKSSSHPVIEPIASAPFSKNPRWLFSLIEELKEYGDHSSLGIHVNKLLAPWPDEDPLRTVHKHHLYLHRVDKIKNEIKRGYDALKIIALSSYIFRDELMEMTGISAQSLIELELMLSEEWSSGVIRLKNPAYRNIKIDAAEKRSLNLKLANFLANKGDEIDVLSRACNHWSQVYCPLSYDPLSFFESSKVMGNQFTGDADFEKYQRSHNLLCSRIEAEWDITCHQMESEAQE